MEVLGGKVCLIEGLKRGQGIEGGGNGFGRRFLEEDLGVWVGENEGIKGEGLELGGGFFGGCWGEGEYRKGVWGGGEWGKGDWGR